MEYEYIGAIKIKDGLFLGDQFSAQDLEFVVTNKVTRIINCASKQIPNHWESIGISYLSFPWLDNESQVIFDQKDEVANKCFTFLEEALSQGESVIVHSVRGHNRSVCVICCYFMKKFRWTLYKTLQYLHNRRPDLEIRANFFNQLLALEARFQKNGFGAVTYNWDDINQNGEDKDEEIVLRNTYLNAQSQGIAEFKDNGKKTQTKIQWLDRTTKQKLETLIIPPYETIDFGRKKQTQQNQKQIPIIKGSREFMLSNSKQQQMKPREFRNHQFNNNNHFNWQSHLMDQDKQAKKQSKMKTKFSCPLVKSSINNFNNAFNNNNSYLKQQINIQILQDVQNAPKINNLMQSQKIAPINKIPKPQFGNTMPASSGDNWFKQPGRKQTQPGRPLTAPNQEQKVSVLPSSSMGSRQNRNNDQLIVTSYKRQGSLGTRTETTGTGNNLFKNKQRAYSPNQVYNANPYNNAKQFSAKKNPLSRK